MHSPYISQHYNQNCEASVYCRELKERMGIPYLQVVLNRELSHHIERTLPNLMATLSQKKRAAEEELKKTELTVEPNTVLER